MKSITDQLIEKSGGIIKVEPEVSQPNGPYHCFDSGGVESEVGEFLYGLVKVLQPEDILETGTYTGISAMYMGAALQDNKHGHLTTIEFEKTHKDRAERLWQATGVNEWVGCVLQSSLDYEVPISKSMEFGSVRQEYDLIFLDSEPGIRFQELVKFYTALKPGGYFFVHDLHRHLSQQPHEQFFGWPYGKLPDQIVEWIKTDKLRVISFPTPRGLSGFYKPRESDFKV